MIAKPKRRLFRFSLRTLLVFMTIASIAFGWLGFKMRQAGRQREAVKAIEETGGRVVYDYHMDNPPDGFVFGGPFLIGPERNQSARPGPAWLRDLLGDDFFINVAYVKVGTSDSINLVHLRQFQRVQWIDVSYNSLVTDAGLVHMQGLPDLRVLYLGRSQVTDAGLIHIRETTRLEELRIGALPVTDAGMVHLRKMTRLRELELEYSKVTDAGLIHLATMPHLRRLMLNGTRVTDAGLTHLSVLHELELLTLDDTKITDAGLVHLQSLSHLSSLRLNRTLVTREGCEALQRALPNLQIYHLY
jgi:Leucine Rich repeat